MLSPNSDDLIYLTGFFNMRYCVTKKSHYHEVLCVYLPLISSDLCSPEMQTEVCDNNQRKFFFYNPKKAAIVGRCVKSPSKLTIVP